MMLIRLAVWATLCYSGGVILLLLCAAAQMS